MAGKIIMWAVCFGCAILFFAIGLYAKKLKKPMWFWAGTEVDPATITDVKAYNRENGIMWQVYSLWYLAAGLAEFWNAVLAVVFLVLGCSVGIVLLVGTYLKIHKKYSVHEI